MADCLVDSCNLMTSGACGTALPVQNDLVLGISPFSISATELNPLGYI